MTIQGAAVNKSANEVAEGISRLSVADRVRLLKAARYFSRHLSMSPEDLLQEAITRALEGTRHCPTNLDLTRFLVGVMRSLRSAEIKSGSRQPKLYVVPMVGEGDEGEISFNPSDPGPNQEDTLASTQTAAAMRENVLKLFDDDPVCQIIVDGMMENMCGKDLCELAEIDEKELATKHRFIRRRLDKAFPKEGAP